VTVELGGEGGRVVLIRVVVVLVASRVGGWGLRGQRLGISCRCFFSW
jgi:hypothetical protein